MTIEQRQAIEAEIRQLLLREWDPLGLRENTEQDADTYAVYAHEVYNLLARGASDTQVGRRLHLAERDELQHPELVERDLTPLLRALRQVERRM